MARHHDVATRLRLPPAPPPAPFSRRVGRGRRAAAAVGVCGARVLQRWPLSPPPASSEPSAAVGGGVGRGAAPVRSSNGGPSRPGRRAGNGGRRRVDICRVAAARRPPPGGGEGGGRWWWWWWGWRRGWRWGWWCTGWMAAAPPTPLPLRRSPLRPLHSLHDTVAAGDGMEPHAVGGGRVHWGWPIGWRPRQPGHARPPHRRGRRHAPVAAGVVSRHIVRVFIGQRAPEGGTCAL